jgi:hypothetical protein
VTDAPCVFSSLLCGIRVDSILYSVHELLKINSRSFEPLRILEFRLHEESTMRTTLLQIRFYSLLSLLREQR